MAYMQANTIRARLERALDATVAVADPATWAIVEGAIALLDDLDGDPDLEPDCDREQDAGEACLSFRILDDGTDDQSQPVGMWWRGEADRAA